MSMTGENSDDLMKLSSSDESPKEPEEVAETPTNAKNKRKGKKVVEATSGRGKRKKKSIVWDHFKEVEGDAYHAECVYCSQMISCASSNGTNAMKRHTSRYGLKDVDVSVVRVRAAVKYVRKAFKNLKTKYLPYTKELRKIGGAPDDEDWDKIASFLPFLQMFYEATLSFSGSRYVTGNTFVEEVYDIGYNINRSVDDLNDGVKSMARQMKLKFDKHKLRYVEWIIRRSYDPSDSYDLCHRIKSTLASLFDFYASSHPSSTQTRSSSFNPYSSAHDDWIRASHDPIMIEESLLALENMEEEMQDLTLEQPTIIIDETSEVPELFL
ncbi:hypothetical protein V6N11_064683 [Hibiscus sabdariffa]|uniref:BED-type domain-containing protein n=1 Tax=Hibiscus sabdariffa TaxID=183260 RepID=A0ABR2NBC7_9ROSI